MKKILLILATLILVTGCNCKGFLSTTDNGSFASWCSPVILPPEVTDDGKEEDGHGNGNGHGHGHGNGNGHGHGRNR